MSTENKEELRKEFDEYIACKLEDVSETNSGTDGMIGYVFDWFYSKLEDKDKEIEAHKLAMKFEKSGWYKDEEIEKMTVEISSLKEKSINEKIDLIRMTFDGLRKSVNAEPTMQGTRYSVRGVHYSELLVKLNNVNEELYSSLEVFNKLKS